MKENIEGIFLKRIPYSDSQSIAYLFTEEYGVLPFMYRRKNKQNFSAYLAPLNIVLIQTQIKTNKDIQYFDNIQHSLLLLSIYENIHKLSIAQFMADFLFNLLIFPQSDKQLYYFLRNWTINLNNATKNKDFLNWHFYGLFQLIKLFGFEPKNNCNTNEPYLNIELGMFTSTFTDQCITKHLSLLWSKMLENPANYINIDLNKETKRLLLQSLIKYFSIHTHRNISLNSLPVLEEMYSD